MTTINLNNLLDLDPVTKFSVNLNPIEKTSNLEVLQKFGFNIIIFDFSKFYFQITK